MYDYTFGTVPPLTRFKPLYRAYLRKRKQPPSWTTAFLFRRYAK